MCSPLLRLAMKGAISRMPSIETATRKLRRGGTGAVLLLVAILSASPALAASVGSGTSPTASTTPGPVRQLLAAVTGDRATVSWQPPAVGSASSYSVEAFLGGIWGSPYGTRVVAGTSIVWDRLPLNQPVQFSVTPIGSDASGSASGPVGPVNDTGVVVARNDYCQASASTDCVVVNTTQGEGQEKLPGAGLMHGTVPAGNPYASQLHLTHWRIQAANPEQYAQASAFAPPTGIIEILSDAWYNATVTRVDGVPKAADPWSNWDVYQNFIESTVRKAESQGQNPYWEIQNEPEYYPYNPAQPATRALVEEQYLYAYQAIKAVDASARVIGPSIDWQYQYRNASWYIDMKSFIPYAADHGMKFAAVAWHDNYDTVDSSPLKYQETPQSIRDQAAQVRELIAANPGIGSPLLFVDEQSSPAGQYSPGWQAGYLAEDDRAGVALANRSCWVFPGDTNTDADCFGPYLDQLLNKDGAPNASFWTMVDYNAMKGTRVWSESSDTNLSNLAVTDRSGKTRILLGRHESCSGWTAGSRSCPVTQPPAAVPTTLQVLVPTGADSATVEIQALPDTLSDLPSAPAATTTPVPVVNGVATVAIPSFDDGAAYFVTVTPDSTSGAAPASGSQSAGEWPPASGPSQPTRVVLESGDYQSAMAVQPLANPLVALVTDQYGNPMPDQNVTFVVGRGGGSFPHGQRSVAVMSDSSGLAISPRLTTGLSPGAFTANAFITSSGLGVPQAVTYYAYFVHIWPLP